MHRPTGVTVGLYTHIHLPCTPVPGVALGRALGVTDPTTTCLGRVCTCIILVLFPIEATRRSTGITCTKLWLISCSKDKGQEVLQQFTFRYMGTKKKKKKHFFLWLEIHWNATLRSQNFENVLKAESHPRKLQEIPIRRQKPSQRLSSKKKKKKKTWPKHFVQTLICCT